jgi:hypothetical protein
MDDLDVLVAPRQAGRALAVLRDAGWKPPAPHTEDLFAVKHGVGLVRNSPVEGVDLHWRTFPYSAAGEDDLWSGSVPLTLGGVPTRTLSPADHLLHVCSEGVAWNPVRPIRWVVDATVIVRSAGARLDWDRFCQQAARREQLSTARTLLAYLRGTFAPEIPQAVIDRLLAMPARRADGAVHRALVARPPSARRAWRTNRAAHRALAAAPGAPAIGFLDFLAQHWDLGTRRELALHVARKAGGVLRAASYGGLRVLGVPGSRRVSR